MKKKLIYPIIGVCLFLLAFFIVRNSLSNPSQKDVETYTIDYLLSLKKEAVAYEDSLFESGDIPMKALIKATGTITKTDSKTSPDIAKDDRFILLLSDGKTRLHVINSSAETPKLHETVTIYGEYNGIIVANLVETSD